MAERDDRDEDVASPLAPEATRAVQSDIDVNASPESVWAALTDARELERWFPQSARVTPGPGGSVRLSWTDQPDVDAVISEWDPPERLGLDWSDAAAGQRTDFLLVGKAEATSLRATHRGMPWDSGWDTWADGTQDGWRFQLHCLKHYLERRKGEDRAVVHAEVQVALPQEDAWERLTGGDGVTAEAAAGRVIVDEPPRQRVIVTERPPDGLLLLSVQPATGGARSPTGAPLLQKVRARLSAWGGDRKALRGVQDQWERALARVFPERIRT